MPGLYCVNRTEQFKFLAEKYKVSEDTLAQIIYKYDKGGQSFPSEEYIQAQLGQLPYEEPSATLREGWEKLYKDPKVFKSADALLEAQKQAESLFPGHVYTYQDNQGNYVLRVQQPIEKLETPIQAAIEPNATTTSEEFYTKENADEYVQDLINDGTPKENIQIVHTPATDTTDDYWTVTVKGQDSLSQEVTQETVKHLEAIFKTTGNIKYEDEMEEAINKWGTKSLQEAFKEQKEMEDIKQKAIADGTFMKAPNGKPTNLNERQWLQVRTKNFINWFGDWMNDPANASKVVDENGEPLVVYRGGTKNSNLESRNGAYYVTPSKEYADTYTKQEGGNTEALFLNAKNPKEIKGTTPIIRSDGKTVASRGLFENPLTFDDILTLLGDNDAVISGGEYMVSDSNQIKSATDNNGVFSIENDDIQAFQTSEGEIYGFVDPKDNLYLDRRVITAEHPIHEYTHLWDRYVAKKNSEFWKTGVGIIKQTSEWQEVLNDPNYGQKWKAMKGMTDSKLESLIASEVHARLTGRRGKETLERIAKETESKGVVAKLKQWLLDFWKELKSAFTPWTDKELKELEELAAKDIDAAIQKLSDMTLKDFAEGVNPITQQMEKVQEATPTQPQSDTAKSMTDYERRNTQLNNLLDNNVGLRPSEVREVAEDVVNSISDIITELHKNTEKAKEYFPDLNTTVDFSTATRKEIVTTVGVNRLITLAKNNFSKLKDDETSEAYDLYDDSSLIDQASLILDNWETIMEIASDVFVANEGFGIKRNTKEGKYEANEQEYTGYDYDNYVEYQDEDSIAENENEQEHWQIETRTIDVMNSMSDLVRMALHECYILDRNGNKVLSKFGIPTRVDKRKAVSAILYWTQGTLDINQMIEKLEAKAEKQPWLTQLIRRLKDTSGAEADFQSQFYSVMHRPFQLYGIGQLEDGEYVSKPVNNHKVLFDIMKSLNAQFQLNEIPLFTKKGIHMGNLDTFTQYQKELEKITDAYNIRSINNVVTANKELEEEDIERVARILQGISRMLGYPASEDTFKGIITTESLHTMANATRKIQEKLTDQSKIEYKDYHPFEYNQKNGIEGYTKSFLAPIVEELEETAVTAFFEDGKMYQSYVVPSFLTQLFDQFGQKGEAFHTWMESFYGTSQWFKKEGRWRNPWSQIFARRDSLGDKARDIFDHKVQLTFNKHSYMRNMTPEEYTISVFTEYFASKTDEKDPEHTPAWLRVPIQSNKPSSDFIRFFSDRSADYKNHIVTQMFEFYLQELDRIDTVRKRNQQGQAAEISSFDENGRMFQFMPFLNGYLVDNGEVVDKTGGDIFKTAEEEIDTEKNSELKKLLNKKLNAETKLTEQEESRLATLVQEATFTYMEDLANTVLDKWERTGILQAAERVQGIKDGNRSVRENLENFFWNDFFAANNILQLTIVDKAFYDNSVKLQKRLAELHAPGTRGNKYATDYEGQRVSDGVHRTVILSDLDKFTTNIIENISEVFNKLIENAKSSEEKAGLEALQESLVGPEGRYRKINVTDGQAYSSPSSYRKKMLMFGKWSNEAERTYQKLLKGDANLAEIEIAFQPLKPFVYGHVQKNMGVSNAPIQSMPVPFQAKNAEYLLVMADALLQGQQTGRPNLLKVITDIMEESEKMYPGQGIDTIQFASAVKSGGQGIINIAQYLTMPGGEEAAYTELKNQIFQENLADDKTTYNYDVFVHRIDYDNYALQQEVPKHFQDHTQAEPSQMRMNIPSDLDFLNYAGEVNQYTWTDHNGNKHSLNAKEIRKEWEQVHADNIEESLNTLARDLKLDTTSEEERNFALSQILQDEIMSSPRYGIDLMQACQLVDGQFRIPKGDPIQAKRIEQLINSIIKSRVNKQEIAGGPVVQVSNFGTSRQLHIRFNARSGGLLLSKEEWDAQPDHPAHSNYATYDAYKKAEQAGIAKFEVFAPASMKKIFEYFKNPDGSINIEAVRKCDPELLKMITGRIPNEDKYSIAHCEIVGFMPAIAGEAMMFPYELTEIDDSDFDVDKRYCQVKAIDIVVDEKAIKNKLIDATTKLVKKDREAFYKGTKTERLWGEADRTKAEKEVTAFLDNPERMKDSDDTGLMAAMYQEYQRILKEDFPYKTRYPDEGTTDARNNQIIDMAWAIMSNEMTTPKILNPGGFEIPKKNAYVIAAYKASDGKVTWDELEKMSVKQIQKLLDTKKDLARFDVQVQFYKQNAAGSNLIGVFAVNKTAHATLEGDGILVDIEAITEDGNPFTINNTTFEDVMELDPTKDSKGNYIGKNIGQGIGASADTAGDPWLDNIDVNMTTAGMFNTMMRLSMPWEDVALFMSQDAIVKVLEEANKSNLTGDYTSIDAIIGEILNNHKEEAEYTEESTINKQALTLPELRKGLLDYDVLAAEDQADRDEIDYKVLLAFSKLRKIAKAVKDGPTALTRFNSISSAVGPLIIDNIILEHKLQRFLAINNKDGITGFYVKGADGKLEVADTDTILGMHPILKQFSRTVDSRSGNSLCPAKILFEDMPAGSTHFKDVILNHIPKYVADKIYDDRALLSKLSDFYQSYMMVANGMIEHDQIANSINGFPEEFVGKGTDENGQKRIPIKQQYPDNAFIQAIQPDFNKKTGRAFLNINTTGMLEQDKERLRMAWIDLHKENPELSTKLFTYAFYRGGIGFSPRTWMSLVPGYVKEHLTINGTSYVDVYRQLKTENIVPEVFFDQFVRNNWNDYTLAPIKGGEGTHYITDLSKGELYVRNKKDIESLSDVKYMRTVENKNEYVLWKFVGSEQDKRSRMYVRVMPLGNNGEYIEMSTERDIQPMQKTTVAKDQNDTQDMPATSSTQLDAAQVDTQQTTMDISNMPKKIETLIPLAEKAFKLSNNTATTLMGQYKVGVEWGTTTKNQREQMQKLFRAAGLELSPEQAEAEFKKYC